MLVDLQGRRNFLEDPTWMSFSCMFRNEDNELFLLAIKPNDASPALGNRPDLFKIP